MDEVMHEELYRARRSSFPRRLMKAKAIPLALIAVGLTGSIAGGQEATPRFSVVEATIESTHAAIMAGEVTCTEIVQQYIDRARAYNGVCTALVTETGADIPPVEGYVRAGSPITFPTHTVAASTIFPNLSEYQGLPLDFGRMEPTISNPAVFAQMGMRVGMPDAGQVKCSGDAQHPRRALGDMPRRLRRASVDRPPAARRSGDLRDVPAVPGRPGDGSGA
jgi:hypothetical protein